MQQECIVLNQDRNVTLTAYIQPVGGRFEYIPKRPAILVLPGGGYQYCSVREADPVAFAFLKAGYQAFVLNYSVGKFAAWPNPLEDVEQALTMIRSREDWNVYPDKVAVIGFSAGGHLAAAAATLAEERPNAAILGYAVAGSDVTGCNPTAPDTTKCVDQKTPPCFVFATCSDDVVPVQNSLDFCRALADAKISFESHIYAYGPHGFSTGVSGVHNRNTPLCDRVPDWVDDSVGFLRDVLGDFGDGKMTDPLCPRYTTGDNDPALSVDCTVGLLLENRQAVAVLGPLTAQLQGDLVKKMTLRGILGFAKMPADQINRIDEALRQIPNS
ncbi:MAG: alpha/beta hydrolase [Oscillospiraceae bacterium]|nr:alpha/beta hydrolase [Oscillospiraceae bacterium]